jgi:hypothetical protein
MPPTYGNGKICYIEISATDVARSSEFYQAVFGCKVRRRGADAPEITARFRDPAGNVLGIYQQPS